MRGDRIGIVGPNGVGKTTLIRLLLGELDADGGHLKPRHAARGRLLRPAARSSSTPIAAFRTTSATATSIVTSRRRSRATSRLSARFSVPPGSAAHSGGALSGGERNRLLLARLFARPANLLVLDEPTNDLDVETLELLEELVAGFPGTLLLVSHDRAFLDNVVTSLLVFGENGQVTEFVGGYTDFIDWRARQARAASNARAQGSAPTAAASPASVPAVPIEPRKARKLSFKEQRELDELPKLIETLELEKSTLEAEIGDPAFYSRPHTDVTAALAKLTTLGAQIDKRYARWSELDAL